jgi:hypothetical protein
MAIAPNVSLTGTLDYFWTDSSGTPSGDPQASIKFGLHGYGSQIPRVSGQALFQDASIDIKVQPEGDQAGEFELMFYSNDIISPAGTYYTLTTLNGNGDILQINAYRFVGSGQYDASLLEPYDPNQPPPALPPLILNLLLVVPYSPNPDFPGDTYTSWQITLTGDATATFSDLVDGNLYTILIAQDGVGGHNFNWPLNVYNPTGPNREAVSLTVQTFVAVSNMLYPIGAGTYYP